MTSPSSFIQHNRLLALSLITWAILTLLCGPVSSAAIYRRVPARGGASGGGRIPKAIPIPGTTGDDGDPYKDGPSCGLSLYVEQAPDPATLAPLNDGIISPVIAALNDGITYAVTYPPQPPPLPPGPPPPPKQVFAVGWSQACNPTGAGQETGSECASTFGVYEHTDGQDYDSCNDDAIYANPNQFTHGANNVQYPVDIGPFAAAGYNNCYFYSDSSEDPGTMQCDGDVFVICTYVSFNQDCPFSSLRTWNGKWACAAQP